MTAYMEVQQPDAAPARPSRASKMTLATLALGGSLLVLLLAWKSGEFGSNNDLLFSEDFATLDTSRWTVERSLDDGGSTPRPTV